MNSYNIDTDAGIGNILSNLDSDYILHVVEDSLSKKFRPFDEPMPNMVDIWERYFIEIFNNAPDYAEKVKDVRKQTYVEIINIIADYYKLHFTIDIMDIDEETIHTIAKFMYDIFISRFTDNMINFFTSYIIDNSDGIYNYLKNMDNINHPRDTGVYAKNNFIDEKYILINANANIVIYNIAGYDINLSTLLNYFFDVNIAGYLNSILEDTQDIYKYYYAEYIKSPIDGPEVITRIKLELQSRTTNNVTLKGEV